MKQRMIKLKRRKTQLDLLEILLTTQLELLEILLTTQLELLEILLMTQLELLEILLMTQLELLEILLTTQLELLEIHLTTQLKEKLMKRLPMCLARSCKSLMLRRMILTQKLKLGKEKRKERKIRRETIKRVKR